MHTTNYLGGRVQTFLPPSIQPNHKSYRRTLRQSPSAAWPSLAVSNQHINSQLRC